LSFCLWIDRCWKKLFYGGKSIKQSNFNFKFLNNQGIVPQICAEIFEKMKKNKNDDRDYEVFFSMMEIYNEKL
jgi:hypothetical protein